MQTICCTQSSAWTPITQDSEVCRQCPNACYHTLRVAVNSAGSDLGEWSVLFFTGFNEFICDTVAAETRHALSAEQLNVPGSTRWH